MKTFRLIVSTDAPVDFGDFVEILDHSPGSVRFDAAHSVLFNHNPNQIVGGLVGFELQSGRLLATIEIDDEVQTPLGLDFGKALERRYLRGVSVGYTWRTQDVEFTELEDGRVSLRIKKWTVREVSLTPTPADLSSMVLENGSDQAQPRAAAARPVATLVGARSAPTSKKGSVVMDVRDKVLDACVDGLLHQAGMAEGPDLGMRRHSPLDMARKLASLADSDAAGNATRRDLAYWALGRNVRGMRDAANVTSGMFGDYVLANVLSKAAAKGFDDYAKNVTYPLWTGKRSVADFKQFTGAALDAGSLVETTENVAFPELSTAETGYSGTLKMWGATMSLTFQALMNDDLGEFLNALKRIGAIAQRTIDKEVYYQLENASWTGRDNGSSALSDDNLATVRAAMQNLAGPSGEKLGHTARFLLHPPCLRAKALQVSQVASYIAPEEVKVHADIQPISSPHLTEAGTKANSKYYLAADSQIADTVLVCTLMGVEAPMVQEYDAGAVAARKWRLCLPFVAVVPTIYAMYRGGA